MNLSASFYIFLLVVICALFYDCRQPRTGCLNILSPNFDVEAEEPCDDCCDSSEIQLSFIHRINLDTQEISMQLNRLFEIFPNPEYGISVQHFHFYLTDVQFLRTDGQTSTGAGQTIIETDPVTVLQNNHLYIARNIFGETNFGRFEQSGSIEKMQFNLGLTEENNSIIPDSLSGTDHPFRWQTDSLNWRESDQYVFLRMEYFEYLDSIIVDSMPSVIDITSPDLQPIEIDANFDLDIGLNTFVTLKMDYNVLWADIDFENDSKETIKSQILQNISAAISFDNVNQE